MCKKYSYIIGFKTEKEEEEAKEWIINQISNNDFGLSMEELGLTEEDFDDPEYMHEIDDEEEEFSTVKENFKIVNIYKYLSHPSAGYPPSHIGPNTRDFCRVLVNATRQKNFTYNDVLSITPNRGLGQGGSNIYSVYKYRGGKNCKHVWVKYLYDTVSGNLIKAPGSKQPVQVNPGGV